MFKKTEVMYKKKGKEKQIKEDIYKSYTFLIKTCKLANNNEIVKGTSLEHSGILDWSSHQFAVKSQVEWAGFPWLLTVFPAVFEPVQLGPLLGPNSLFWGLLTSS